MIDVGVCSSKVEVLLAEEAYAEENSLGNKPNPKKEEESDGVGVSMSMPVDATGQPYSVDVDLNVSTSDDENQSVPVERVLVQVDREREKTEGSLPIKRKGTYSRILNFLFGLKNSLFFIIVCYFILL